MRFYLPLPDPFNLELSLKFLQRSPREILHRFEGDCIIKLLNLEGENILFSVKGLQGKLMIDLLQGPASDKIRRAIKEYVREWFDLETDLKPFYAMAKGDELLGSLVKKYSGYRIMSHPDLFESLLWAVMGQQINVQFAYTIKQRFVEKFGKKIIFEGREYFSFPTPNRVAELKDQDLLPLQFSRQKARYVVLIAQAFVRGDVSKEKLRDLSLEEAKNELMQIKGIGNWTANYALMRTFRYPDAFPLEDVALQRAIMNLKGLKSKPSIHQVKRIFKKYKGWEAYATLYLWKSL